MKSVQIFLMALTCLTSFVFSNEVKTYSLDDFIKFVDAAGLYSYSEEKSGWVLDVDLKGENIDFISRKSIASDLKEEDKIHGLGDIIIRVYIKKKKEKGFGGSFSFVKDATVETFKVKKMLGIGWFFKGRLRINEGYCEVTIPGGGFTREELVEIKGKERRKKMPGKQKGSGKAEGVSSIR